MTIFVVGSINLDMIARVPRLPQPGETLAGLSFDMAPGGKGANQALAARRAGADVRLYGAVGTDTNAQAALSLLSEAGVELSHVQHRDTTVPTGVALILVDAGTGENEIVVVAGANGTVNATCVADVVLTGDDCVLLQLEVPSPAVGAALAACQQSGARSLLNIAPYSNDAPGLVADADLTIANETEFDLLADAMALAGTTREARAADFARRTGKTMVVTLGGDGAFAAGPDGLVRAQAPKIEPVDTVGAGDTFCGYLGTALSEGMALGDALRLACASGAVACLHRGAQPAIPTRQRVADFIA
ncbi:MAG: ribokinase [Ahrensia sp.]